LYFSIFSECMHVNAYARQFSTYRGYPPRHLTSRTTWITRATAPLELVHPHDARGSVVSSIPQVHDPHGRLARTEELATFLNDPIPASFSIGQRLLTLIICGSLRKFASTWYNLAGTSGKWKWLPLSTLFMAALWKAVYFTAKRPGIPIPTGEKRGKSTFFYSIFLDCFFLDLDMMFFLATQSYLLADRKEAVAILLLLPRCLRHFVVVFVQFLWVYVCEFVAIVRI